MNRGAVLNPLCESIATSLMSPRLLASFMCFGTLGFDPRDYFFGPPAISAAVALVLGGETAIPGGECAPAASSGF